MDIDADPYYVSAIYYDLLAAAHGGRARPFIPFFLRWARPGDRVLDIGAGTGRVSVPLAEHCASVVCVEPSRAMRSILMGKLAAHPYLHSRVTVLDGDGIQNQARGFFDYICLAGCLSFFSSAQRLLLFSEITSRCKSGSIIAMDMVDDEVKLDAAGETATSINIGECTYELKAFKKPNGPSSSVITFSYSTTRDGLILEKHQFDRTRHYALRADVLTELKSMGWHEFTDDSYRKEDELLSDTLVVKLL